MMNQPYYSLNTYLRDTYGEKLYKLSLNAGLSCPNRDGTLDNRGCIFCSAGGSGEFAANPTDSIAQQIAAAKMRVQHKLKGNSYIAYFQAYTNTYAPLSYLRKIFTEAISHPDIKILSIATRPDCLSDDVICLLQELSAIKPVWVELGLQTIHETTAKYIRRGYPLSCFDDAVKRLTNAGIEVIVHMILGLPGEGKEDMLETANYIASLPIQGIKLQLLHILKGTDLAEDFFQNKFEVLELSQYTDIVVSIVERLPQNIVIHRITGDGPKHLMIAPLWSCDKKRVLNTITQEFKLRNTWQGKNR